MIVTAFRARRGALLLGTALLAPTAAFGAYPAKTVTIAVPFPPGGSTGVASTPERMAKFLSDELTRWKSVIATGKITAD